MDRYTRSRLKATLGTTGLVANQKRAMNSTLEKGGEHQPRHWRMSMTLTLECRVLSLAFALSTDLIQQREALTLTRVSESFFVSRLTAWRSSGSRGAGSVSLPVTASVPSPASVNCAPKPRKVPGPPAASSCFAASALLAGCREGWGVERTGAAERHHGATVVRQD